MKNISTQYQDLKEGRMTQHQFLRNARMLFPNHVTQFNSFEDSVKILKQKGLLNEGDAVKGTPDKAPSYDYPTQPGKYMKVVQEPEVDEQDGIYPATTVTDIPKEDVSKPIKSKKRPDGLEPIKDKDTKNEMKKIRIVKESKKNLTEANIKSAAQKAMSTGNFSELDALVLGKPLKETEEDKKKETPTQAPGTSVKMSPQVQDKIQGFLKSFTSAGASAPGESANKLKDKIKEMIRKTLDEYEVGDENDEAPSVLGVIDMIVKKMIDAIESNNLGLEFKDKDVEDELNYFQDTIGHRYSDDQFQDIVDGAVAELKKQGYNIK